MSHHIISCTYSETSAINSGLSHFRLPQNCGSVPSLAGQDGDRVIGKIESCIQSNPLVDWSLDCLWRMHSGLWNMPWTPVRMLLLSEVIAISSYMATETFPRTRSMRRDEGKGGRWIRKQRCLLCNLHPMRLALFFIILTNRIVF